MPPKSNNLSHRKENQIEVRLANKDDVIRINNFYNRIYNKNRTEEQFNWEFNSSPAGKALYVIAEFDSQIVGTQCAIPYYFINNRNETVLSAKSEDTLIDPEFRGMAIFDKMYFLLFMESRKIGIEFIWGFTYAKKPFSKLGFEIPFQSSMGLIVIRPLKAFIYYSKISKNNSYSRKLKILLLCFKSKMDQLLQLFRSTDSNSIGLKFIPLCSSEINYLDHKKLIGLKLDQDFFNYRLHNNPYTKNNYQLNIHEDNELKSSIIYTVNDNLCYILHMYSISDVHCINLIRSLIKHWTVKNCITIRYWGFRNNQVSINEISNLKKSGFTFLRNGISFVGLSLTEKKIDWQSILISRLASQGTG